MCRVADLKTVLHCRLYLNFVESQHLIRIEGHSNIAEEGQALLAGFYYYDCEISKKDGKL